MDIVLVCTIFNKSTIYPDNLYPQMIKDVVCISIPDACNYLSNSYRPYQERNNKLAARFDGAHGQDAKARDGCFLQRHGGERQPPGRRGARSRGTKRSGTKEERDKEERVLGSCVRPL